MVWDFNLNGVVAALTEPIAIFALMRVRYKTIDGQVPDAEWLARLDGALKHFRKVKDKAMANMPGQGGHESAAWT